jgi:hypothetical protein
MADLNKFVMKFPYLAGMDVDLAEEGLRELLPDFTIVKVPIDSLVTMDFRITRIRLFYYPSTRRVAGTPTSG